MTMPYASDHRYVFDVSGKSGIVTFVFRGTASELFNKGGSWTVVIEDLGLS